MPIPSFRALVVGALIVLPIGVGAFVFGVSTQVDWLASSGLATAALTVTGLGLVLACHPDAREIRRLLGIPLFIFFIAGIVDLCGRMLWDRAPGEWYYPSVHATAGVAILALLWRGRTTLTLGGRFTGITLALMCLSFAIWLGSDEEKANRVFAVPWALAVAGIADALWRIIPAKYAAGRLALAGGYLVPVFAGLFAAVMLMGAFDEEDARSYASRGDAWRDKRDANRAIADYTEAIRLDPKYVWAFAGRGDAWRAKGDIDRAIADYSEAIRLAPEYVWAYSNRGSVWHAKGDNDRAIADYSEAIRLDPKYAWAFAGRGDAWRAKGDNDRAIADYSEAIRLDPNYGWAYASRGNAWRARGDRSKALADYNRAIRADPENHRLYSVVAWTLATDSGFAGHGKRAVELATQSCELTAWRNPFYLNTLAAAYAQAGNFRQAVLWQEKALAFPEFAKYSEAAVKRVALYRSGKAYREQAAAP